MIQFGFLRVIFKGRAVKNIAIYYRVSTERQDLRSQTEAIESWLAKRDQQPQKVYTFKDTGYSGSHQNRPAYRDLMKLAINGRIDTIVVYRLDRFSRSASNAIRTLLELDDYGVAFVSVTQPVLSLGHDNPFRRTMLAAFAEIAEIERDTIVARVKSGLQAARKRGIKLGRPSKGTAELLARVRSLRRQGLSYRAIAARVQLSKGKVHNMLNQR